MQCFGKSPAVGWCMEVKKNNNTGSGAEPGAPHLLHTCSHSHIKPRLALTDTSRFRLHSCPLTLILIQIAHCCCHIVLTLTYCSRSVHSLVLRFHPLPAQSCSNFICSVPALSTMFLSAQSQNKTMFVWRGPRMVKWSICHCSLELRNYGTLF